MTQPAVRPLGPSNAPAGLTGSEAARRLAAEGPNELPTARPRNIAEQVRDVVRQPMLLLLLVAGSVNFVLAEPLDGGLLMSFVVVVVTISIYQEHKTENALTALRDLSSPRALVIRDGEQLRIAGRDVVRGDLVLLVEGDRVPADGVVVAATHLSVDESALTGESVPVRKVAVAEGDPGALGRPGGDATPWVFSGTLVVKGRGMVDVRAVGAATELGRIGAALREIEPEHTRLQREVDRLVLFMATLGIGAALTVTVAFALTRGGWLEGTLAGIATAMAMLPEEFPVVLTVFLALGAWRMSQRQVLARRPPVIEALGSATVLCVDKTGTLTMNSMTVREFVADGSTFALSGEPLPPEFADLVETAVLASPVDPFDPMDKAFRDVGETYLPAAVHQGWELVREYPLSESLLALSHAWRPAGEERYVVAAKGAPEAIARLCHLDVSERRALTAQVEAATATGRRVLAVARATVPSVGDLPEEQTAFDFAYLGLAALQDPVRPGVAGAVAECTRAGVRIVMITGDYPGTALAIAREIGLDEGTGCLTGPELTDLTDDELAQRVRTTNVFARVVPEQKLRLVRALKADGEVVGMTGDGVNDAPALRAADIGIAMGKRGTDVARESAALVITDDDFTSIAGGVRQGRGVFENLRKAMAYVVAVHVPIVGMSLVPVFVADWPLVLLPVQIAFLELIIDPACSIVFEVEEIDPAVMDRPPRPVDERVLGPRLLSLAGLQGLTCFAAAFGVYVWSVLTDQGDDVTRSVTFATLVVGNLALILVNRSWRLSVWRTFRERRNPAVPWILAGALGVLAAILSIAPIRDAFDFGPMTPLTWLVAVTAGLAGTAWFEVHKRVRH